MTKVLVAKRAIAQMRGFLKKPLNQVEHGGLVLGCRKNGALEVTKITTPFPSDIGTRASFFRSTDGHSDVANREWFKSGGKTDWIGEWHTHPFGQAAPSYIDRSTWRAITEHTTQHMVFFVAGTSKTYVGLIVAGTKHPIELKVSDETSAFLLYS